MVLEDRASLLRRRQQIRRSKENASSKSNNSSSSAVGATAPRPRKKSLLTKDTEQPVVRKKAPTAATGGSAVIAEPNVALLIRQVLQRPYYGDLGEYLKTATKEQLFEQTLLVAKFAIEVGSLCMCAAACYT